MQRNYPRIFSRADDQDNDGFKLENVGPTCSSFAAVTPNPEHTVRANTSRASDRDESPIELARFFQCLKVETKLDEKSKQLDSKSKLDKQVTQMKFKGNQTNLGSMLTSIRFSTELAPHAIHPYCA